MGPGVWRIAQVPGPHRTRILLQQDGHAPSPGGIRVDYLTVEQARQRTGLRLALTAGVPGPWSEAAKAVMRARRVDFLAVRQEAMQPNDELLAWTGHRNAPIACLGDEPPQTGWLEILLLAERLGRGPSLLPEDEAQRALCLGFITAIVGPDGLGWQRRIQMSAAYLDGPGAGNASLQRILKDYGVTPAAVARTSTRIASILGGLADQLRRQQAAGSPYFIGATLTALDLYWPCFSMMLRPLSAEVNPMPEWLWPLYATLDATVAAAVDPLLIAHRDRIYGTHIALPLDY